MYEFAKGPAEFFQPADALLAGDLRLLHTLVVAKPIIVVR